MSEPLYSSSFEYVQQSLDLNQAKELNNLNKNGNNKATNSTLMDYYAHRFQNEQLSPILETISSFYDFVIKYKVIKGQLTPRKNNKEIIIVTYPKVRYNTKIIENHIDYCYFQLIKYSNWNIADLEILKNRSTAIDRFEIFYQNASDELKDTIR